MRLENHDLKKPMATQKDDVVTVVRGDGKEFVIKRSLVAEHINRGFTVKDKKDQPTEEELQKAVGYTKKAPKPADGGTVPEEKAAQKSAKPKEKAAG